MLTRSEFKKIKSLQQKKFRDGEGKFLIEGIHLIQEAPKFRIEVIIYNEYFIEKHEDILNTLTENKIRIEKINNKDFESLSDTVTSQGIIAVIRKDECIINDFIQNLNRDEKFVFIGLEEISDPGNLGTIIRTADWFGIGAIFISKNSVEIYNPKVIRSTMGSIFHLPIFENIDLPDTILKLKKEHFFVYSTGLSGVSYNHINYKSRIMILFGSESKGISENLKRMSDEQITIPSKGKTESLNLSVSVGVVLSRIIH